MKTSEFETFKSISLDSSGESAFNLERLLSKLTAFPKNLVSEHLHRLSISSLES